MNRPFVAAVWLHAVVLVGLSGTLGGPGVDFASYRNAALAVWEGLDPYDVEVLARWPNPALEGYPVHPFIYPPPALLLLLPLGTLPVRWAWVAWTVGMEAAALCSLWLWTRAGERLDPRLAWLVGAAFALGPATLVNLQESQINWWVVAVTYLGLALVDAPRTRFVGGLLIGTAAAVKVTPVILLPWLILRRRWTALAGALCAGVGTSVAVLPWVGPAWQVHFYREVLPSVGAGTIQGLVLSPTAVYLNGPLPVVRNLLEGTGLDPAMLWRLGLPLAALLAVAREPEDPQQRQVQPVLLLTAMALTPSFLYEHHLIWLYPAWALVAWWAWTGRRWAVPGAVAGGLALLVPLAPLHGLSLGSETLRRTARGLQALDALGLLLLVVALFAHRAASARKGRSNGVRTS